MKFQETKYKSQINFHHQISKFISIFLHPNAFVVNLYIENWIFFEI